MNLINNSMDSSRAIRYKTVGRGLVTVHLGRIVLGYLANSESYNCIDYKGFRFAFISQYEKVPTLYSNSRVELKKEILNSLNQ